MTYKTALVTGGAIRIGKDYSKNFMKMATTLFVTTINQRMPQRLLNLN